VVRNKRQLCEPIPGCADSRLLCISTFDERVS
jgi:hypothetical protein